MEKDEIRERAEIAGQEAERHIELAEDAVDKGDYGGALEHVSNADTFIGKTIGICTGIDNHGQQMACQQDQQIATKQRRTRNIRSTVANITPRHRDEA